ncbi:hypothetical protein [Rhabdothermincola sediminis]|uniref:hypothetical protein n=1 Tax=Rhabdothermincola sediminis TaxID=2751370 RepID=UPI001AA06BE8|nr:hypothetical protein [Rhabdothermincola sediminis]
MSTLDDTLDLRAIGAGLLVAMVIATPVVVAARVASGGERGGASAWSAAVAVASLVAAGAGGLVAGRRQGDWPALNAAATGATLYAAVRLLWALLGGSVPNVLSLILVTILYASVGAVGGAIGSMRKVRDP